MGTTIREGQILYYSWGYGQTNIDFFKVIRLTKSSAIIQKLRSQTVEEDGSKYKPEDHNMCGYKIPTDELIPEWYETFNKKGSGVHEARHGHQAHPEGPRGQRAAQDGARSVPTLERQARVRELVVLMGAFWIPIEALKQDGSTAFHAKMPFRPVVGDELWYCGTFWTVEKVRYYTGRNETRVYVRRIEETD